MTNLELHVGQSITKPETLKKIDELFVFLEVVDITAEMAGTAGDFRRIYGTSIPDALIAASAFYIRACVVTRNVKHFQPIEEIQTKEL